MYLTVGNMYLLYADEFGHDGIWDPNDSRHNHHPLFGLAGFAIPAEKWRDLDRGFLRLKRKFYAWELQRGEADGVRAERFEAKDLSSRRDLRFVGAVLSLLKSLDARIFVHGRVKRIGGPHDSDALYGMITQGLMRAFEKYVRNRVGHKLGSGLMVLDRRTEARDVQLLSSAQSYLFSAQDDLRGGFHRLVEIPMLVRSEWHHGVQAADTIARLAGRLFRYRACGDASHDAKKIDEKLGSDFDGLKYSVDKWSTVYVV